MPNQAETSDKVQREAFEKLHGDNRPDPNWRPDDPSHETFPSFEAGFHSGWQASRVATLAEIRASGVVVEVVKDFTSIWRTPYRNIGDKLYRLPDGEQT